MYLKLNNNIKQKIYLNLNNKNVIQCIGYNSMGKTILLKTILNQLEKKKDILVSKKKLPFSTSQIKKDIFSTPHHRVWLIDEPYNALDYFNFIYIKTKLIEHINKNGIVIYTQNKLNNKNKKFYFYYSTQWI